MSASTSMQLGAWGCAGGCLCADRFMCRVLAPFALVVCRCVLGRVSSGCLQCVGVFGPVGTVGCACGWVAPFPFVHVTAGAWALLPVCAGARAPVCKIGFPWSVGPVCVAWWLHLMGCERWVFARLVPLLWWVCLSAGVRVLLGSIRRACVPWGACWGAVGQSGV